MSENKGCLIGILIIVVPFALWYYFVHIPEMELEEVKKFERIELRLQPKSKTTDNGNNHQSDSGSPIDDVQSAQVNSASKIVDNNHQESPPKTGTDYDKKNPQKTLYGGSFFSNKAQFSKKSNI